MKNIRTLLYAAAGLIIFYFDTLIPLGFGIWITYILLCYMFLRRAPRNHILYIVPFYLALIGFGYFLSPAPVSPMVIPIVNRLGAGLLLVFFAMLGLSEKKSKEDKAEILDRINDLFFIIDNNFRLKFLNTSAKNFNGFKNAVPGKNYFDILPAKNSLFEEKVRESLLNQKNLNFESEIPSEQSYLDVSVYPSKEGLSIFARDITKRVEAEIKLKKLLQEKETLLKEIHHRTKNNLQLILSLLNLQINKVDNQTIIQILQETRTRLLSLSALHDKLHIYGDIYNVDMSALIEDIVVKMDTAANFGLVKIKHELDIEEVSLQVDMAIPIGLIINELYTNSLKYAFDGKQNCMVKISLKFEDNDTLRLYYKDNGRGFPEGFSLDTSEGLGSSLINAFVEQLNGQVTFRNNNGAELNITLKAIRQPDEILIN